MIKFGFECEYFLRSLGGGEIIRQVPTSLPYDARLHLVEVRSAATSKPDDTLVSFLDEKEKLRKNVEALGYELVNIDSHQYENPKWLETAGFHFHLSNGIGIWDIKTLCVKFDADLALYVGKRKPPSGDKYRVKTYGWEYRMLPATVNPTIVTDYLKGVEW